MAGSTRYPDSGEAPHRAPAKLADYQKRNEGAQVQEFPDLDFCLRPTTQLRDATRGARWRAHKRVYLTMNPDLVFNAWGAAPSFSSTKAIAIIDSFTSIQYLFNHPPNRT